MEKDMTELLGMNHFEDSLVKYFGKDRLRKIQKVKVGIAGAGGLGSNCAANLVRSGFRKFVVCDFDIVEMSNLNRQFYFPDQIGMPKIDALAENLFRINPSLELEMVKIKINEGNAAQIFSSCDIVVEAFDCAISKRILAETYANFARLYVSASGIAGWGDSDGIAIRKINDNFYMVGDARSEVSEGLPPCSPRVSIAAAKEADIVLSWVINS